MVRVSVLGGAFTMLGPRNTALEATNLLGREKKMLILPKTTEVNYFILDGPFNHDTSVRAISLHSLGSWGCTVHQQT